MNIIRILDHCDHNIPVARKREGGSSHPAVPMFVVATKDFTGSWNPSKFFPTQDEALEHARDLASKGAETKVASTQTKQTIWRSR